VDANNPSQSPKEDTAKADQSFAKPAWLNADVRPENEIISQDHLWTPSAKCIFASVLAFKIALGMA
jgi:hypothetical protein